MAKFWLSYRLADHGDYERTYSQRVSDLDDEIMAACGKTSGTYWEETTSFYILETTETLDQLVTRVKRAIDERADLVVIRKLDFQTGRVIGNCVDPDIFVLAPYLKKV